MKGKVLVLSLWNKINFKNTPTQFLKQQYIITTMPATMLYYPEGHYHYETRHASQVFPVRSEVSSSVPLVLSY